MKRCLTCKIDFQPPYRAHRQKFCTVACRRRMRTQKARAKPRSEWFTSDEQACPVCRGSLPANRQKSQRFCSQRCYAREHSRANAKKLALTPRGIVKLRLSARLRKIMYTQGSKKKCSVSTLLGCTTQELAYKMEQQFTGEMSWSNYGIWGWHIDHYIPCQKFDLTRLDHQRVCFHWRNLRPLWHTDNWRRKHYMSEDEKKNVDPELLSMLIDVGISL